jgi:DNA-binding CsgD family transcriptional regulator
MMRDIELTLRRIEESWGALTQREREVLSAALTGLTSEETAAKLDISHRTVESHRSNIVRKFDVANLSDLFRIAAGIGFAQIGNALPVRSGCGEA